MDNNSFRDESLDDLWKKETTIVASGNSAQPAPSVAHNSQEGENHVDNSEHGDTSQYVFYMWAIACVLLTAFTTLIDFLRQGAIREANDMSSALTTAERLNILTPHWADNVKMTNLLIVLIVLTVLAFLVDTMVNSKKSIATDEE